MEMTPHLNHDEVAEALSSPASGVGTHLEVCDTCLDETSRIRQAVRVLRAEEAKPEDFWLRQQEAIEARILHCKRRKGVSRPRAWMVGAAASFAVILVALMLRTAIAPKLPMVKTQAGQTQAVEAQEEQDHALLLAVEESLAQNGPDALQPATILAQEISPQDFSSNSSGSKR